MKSRMVGARPRKPSAKTRTIPKASRRSAHRAPYLARPTSMKEDVTTAVHAYPEAMVRCRFDSGFMEVGDGERRLAGFVCPLVQFPRALCDGIARASIRTRPDDHLRAFGARRLGGHRPALRVCIGADLLARGAKAGEPMGRAHGVRSDDADRRSLVRLLVGRVGRRNRVQDPA